MEFIISLQRKQDIAFASMAHAIIQYKRDGLAMGHTTIQEFVQLEQETLVIAIQLVS